MADHYIGLNRGALTIHDNAITYGTSTGSTDVELRIADAAGWTRHEIHIALELIQDFLQGPNVIAGTKFPPG